MNNRVQDTLLGLVLLVIAISWTVLVIKTVPPGYGDGEIGPRAFPLVFGIALIVLATLLVAWPYLTRRFFGRSDDRLTTDKPDNVSNNAASEQPQLHWVSALMVLVQILLYGFLLQKIGFLLATPIIVLLVMIISLRIFSPQKLIGMALGITVGCWLIFEKVMGIYLAKGSWFNIG